MTALDNGLVMFNFNSTVGDYERYKAVLEQSQNSIIIKSGNSRMLLIRPERPEDTTAIRQVNEQAFGRADEANLVDTLRTNGKAVLSLVGVEGDHIVGHIFFSPVTIESYDRLIPGVGLAPMAVVPERQRRGLGSRLVRAGLDECRNAGYNYVVVLGHPTYYPRFGFVPASRYGITSEYKVPDEAFMVLAWHGGTLREVGGVARYEPEFRVV